MSIVWLIKTSTDKSIQPNVFEKNLMAVKKDVFRKKEKNLSIKGQIKTGRVSRMDSTGSHFRWCESCAVDGTYPIVELWRWGLYRGYIRTIRIYANFALQIPLCSSPYTNFSLGHSIWKMQYAKIFMLIMKAFTNVLEETGNVEIVCIYDIKVVHWGEMGLPVS